MLIRTGICLVIPFWIPSLVWAQMVPATNPSFEEGHDSPVGWELVGSGEWRKGDAADRDRAIAATGNGQNDSYWLSGQLPLKPATVYSLSFAARMKGSGGTPVSGPLFCNRDLGQVSDEWKYYDSIFVTPATLVPRDCRLRFGQWQVNGAVCFDDVKVREVRAIHSRKGDITLGEGELIVADKYSFEAPFRSELRNYSRPLDSFNCTFNTDRWVFGTGSVVVYRHAIATARQKAAEVTVAVTWHQSGRLLVEASKDGDNWTALGRIEEVATKTFLIPPSMLPADVIYVRLCAEVVAAAPALQVGGYAFKATLPERLPTFAGMTALGSEEENWLRYPVERLAIRIQDMDVRVPDSFHHHLRLRIENNTGMIFGVQPFTRTTTGSGSSRQRWSVPGSRQMLPLGTSSLLVAYDLPGTSGVANEVEIMLGSGTETATAQGVALLYSAVRTVRVPDLSRSDFGLLLRSGNTRLWWASSGWKIGREAGVPQIRGKAIQISAARNETEAAQLVIRPAERLRGFKASAGALRGPGGATLAAENVEILRVGHVVITTPTDSTGLAGEWPDPLPPLAAPVDLPAEQNQVLWIRVRIPGDAKPGDYAGLVKLSADDYADAVALRVHVYDFALPDRMTCRTALGFSPEVVWRYQKLQKPEDRRLVLDKYLADFAAHHISPYDPAPLDRIKVTWADAKANPRAVFDFAAWDAAMARAIDQHHFNSFILHIPGMGGGTFHSRVDPELLGFKEDTPQYKVAFESYCKQLQEHLRQKGWLKYGYVYWFDEPAKKDYEFVMNGFRKLKSAAPDLNRMLTEKVEPELVGGPNTWCPISNNYNHERAEARRKEGEKFWWYVCTGPKAPYCTLFIDHPATEMRVWLWQTWQRKIDGILIWATNWWTSDTAYPDRANPQNPYEDPMSWTSGYGVPVGTKQPWGNGDGRFIYPPESAASGKPDKPIIDGPVDSIRWEMLRDGIEDHEYHVILRGLIDQKKAKLTPEQRQRLEKLLEVPPAITSDMTTFTKDPQPIEERRHAIAEAIESLK